MNKVLLHSISTALLSILFLITSCSSDDSSSSGGGGGGGATIPADALLIDSSNKAEASLLTAAFTGVAVSSAFGVETATIATAQDLINTLQDRIQRRLGSSPAIVAGVDLSSEFCPDGGSANGDEVETSTSYIANLTLNGCVDGATTLTGNFSANNTFSASTGPYTSNLSGDLTIVDSSGTIGFNGFSFIVSGDDSTGAYTATAFTFSYSPAGGGGFLTQLTQSLIGNEFVSCELNSGQVLISGASGSQARATINPDGSAILEYHAGDGNFIPTDNSPWPCLI